MGFQLDGADRWQQRGISSCMLITFGVFFRSPILWLFLVARYISIRTFREGDFLPIKLWCLILPITKSNHFDSGRWMISQSFESVRNYEAYCIVRFFFHISEDVCIFNLLQSEFAPPKGGKKIMIDRCFFILMEANDRYKLIAWWGSNDIMIKREKRDGRVTFKSHDVIKNRKRIKYSGVCVINDYVEARVFLEFVAYFY